MLKIVNVRVFNNQCKITWALCWVSRKETISSALPVPWEWGWGGGDISLGLLGVLKSKMSSVRITLIHFRALKPEKICQKLVSF